MIEFLDRFRQCNGLEINEKKLNCVFMSFYTHLNVKDKYKGKTELVPAVLMQMRVDGAIGFPGGKVEKTDYTKNLNEYRLKKALMRELKEEINLDMRLDFSKINHLSTFASNELYIHNFSYKLTEEEFMKVFEQSNKPLNIAENAGCIICLLNNFGHGQGYRNFQKNNFKATSLAELRMLRDKLKPALI